MPASQLNEDTTRSRPALSRAELRDFADRLADEPERWAHLMSTESDDLRVYDLIWDDGEVNAWVIRWSGDADTGYHDHDDSAAGIAVIAGEVREDRLSLGGLPRVRLIGPGETFIVEPNAIHRVLHSGTGPALTIHAYSPPLRRMGAYHVTPEGVLERESKTCESELRAQAPCRVSAHAPAEAMPAVAEPARRAEPALV